MSCPFGPVGSGPSRRGLLIGAGGLVAGAGAARLARAATPQPAAAPGSCEPFYSAHQGGIATSQQMHSYFAAFDLTAKTRDDVIAMLRAWTATAARMTSGQTARPMGEDVSIEAPDGGAALGLAPAA
jgi:deferrochelatase/peroxidase EfeB